jgi:hypothetical protein
MIDGIGSRPFSAVTIPPIEKPAQTMRKEVIEASRMTYANPRDGVESAIMAELAAGGGEAEPEPPPKKRTGDYQRSNSSSGGERRSAPPQREFSEPRPAFVPRAQLPREERREPERHAPLPPVSQPRPVEQQAPRSTPPPLPPQRSADDLRAILRSVTTKTVDERQKKEVTQQSSLKSALKEVLQKSGPPTGAMAQPKPIMQPQLPSPASIPPSHELPLGAPEKPKPFEVPEDQLRSILKGE